MYVELITRFDKRKKELWQKFLQASNLYPEDTACETVLLWDDEQIIGAGSRDGNLLKYIAVSNERQGEDLTAIILSELKKSAFAQGYNHLFLYTKPQNEKIFQSLFFYTVAKTEQALLMENRKDGIVDFLNELCTEKAHGCVGSIVMNANPFTLGHRFLVETAARKCDKLYVFVVSEDKSLFSATDRIKMVQIGTADIPNVTVLPTGPYLVSSATFPTYFLKEREKAKEVQCLLDVAIFADYFAPHFGINHRFIGTEPLSPLTNQYNKALKSGLGAKGIEVLEIPRLESDGTAISASRVRELIENKETEAIKRLVPATTFNYLKSNF